MNNGLLKSLRKTCTAKIDYFRQFGDVTETDHGPMIFQDNGAKILAVAHLDTVMETKFRLRGTTVKCSQLDDRLGVWTLMHLLPSLGCIDFDLLLCDSEEIGESTAQYFDAPKDYNWIFEFDRAGSDVVMYDYEDEDSVALLDRYKFDVGSGSYTDICMLEGLGCKAFNFGVGYYDQHSKWCNADLRDTLDMATRFCEFAKKESRTHLPHTMVEKRYGGKLELLWDYEADGWDDVDWSLNKNDKIEKGDLVQLNQYPESKSVIGSYCPHCEVEFDKYAPWCPYCGAAEPWEVMQG